MLLIFYKEMYSLPSLVIVRQVVGSSHPGGEVTSKGRAVRPLKWYASWVQNVVRQFGLYPV